MVKRGEGETRGPSLGLRPNDRSRQPSAALLTFFSLLRIIIKDREVGTMFKEYMSKLPFLQASQSKSRKRERTEREAAPIEEENLWPEGDPFAPDPVEEAAPSDHPAQDGAFPAPMPPEAADEMPAAPQPPALFAAGRDAYRAGDYGAALEDFLRAAEQGHIESQFLCGQMYRRGVGVEANDKLALSWYKRAAKQGHLGGQMACGSIYEEGRGTAVDLKRALSWYEQAAKQGCVDAQLKCGYMYYGGRAETRNPKKARRWMESAAESGNEEAKKFLEERF